jgi:hypothetical protein
MIRPITSKKNPNAIPAVELLNAAEKELFKLHITSKGVPGNNSDTATIKATAASRNAITAIMKTPFGLFSTLHQLSFFCAKDGKKSLFVVHQAPCHDIGQ